MRLWIVGGLLGAGIAAAIALSSVTDRYVASAVVRIAPRVAGANPAVLEQGAAEQLRIVAEELRGRQTLAKLVGDLYPWDRANLPLEEIQHRMADDIEVSPEKGGGEPPLTARISFAYREREQARVVVDRLAARMVELNEEENRSRRASWKLAPGFELSVISRGNARGNSALAVRAGYVADGLCAGGVLGWLIAFVIAWPRRALQAAAFGGCVAALLWSWALPDRYTSTAVVAIAPELVSTEHFSEFQEALPVGSFAQIRAAMDAQELYVRMARGLYPDVEAHQSMPAAVALMREHLSIRQEGWKLGSGEKFKISFTHGDAAKASLTLRRLIAELESMHMSMKLSTPTAMGVREMFLLREAATTPEVPDGIGFGGAAAMGASLGLVVWWVRLRRRGGLGAK